MDDNKDLQQFFLLYYYYKHSGSGSGSLISRIL